MLDKFGRPLFQKDPVLIFGQIQATYEGYKVMADGTVLAMIETPTGWRNCYSEEIQKIWLRNPNRQKGHGVK